ncbi:MAG TPA: DUF4159 domain-containing protein [Gemmatimonadaceae bacterium]|jgi:hypothetical protein|nr:DUF4159 domain-containing protein [Gemmatimonadaceae bacterium]
MRTSRRLAVVLGVLLLIGAASAGAQRWRRFTQEPNAPYDGRFTFVRLSYTVGWHSGWEFDYPAMERNFMTILNDLTTVHPHVRESNIHAMDDPELGRYPIAYLSEPGWWHPDDSQAAGLRTWLAKGGFLIVDDFYFPSQWQNFDQAIHKVLPEAKIYPLDVSHPVFQSFFHIATLKGMSHPDNANALAEYKGIYEDNDPSKRLIVVINYNNDIGDYMEWSGQGFYAINFSNDAYKLATNYVVYGLTH